MKVYCIECGKEIDHDIYQLYNGICTQCYLKDLTENKDKKSGDNNKRS